MEKVVVVGGSGFMGSHVADDLSNQGYDVVIFDQTPSPWLLDSQEMVVGDIQDRKLIRQVLDGASYVYHYAGVADIGDADNHPYDALQANIMGTISLIDACVDTTIKRFVYASSMYVYSSKGSFYRVSKQVSEQIIETYQEKYNLDYTFLRYGSLYGPRSQDWNGLKGYVKQIVENHSLDYHGTGKERREYIHVKDAARLSVNILDEQHKNRAITVTGQQVLASTELIDMIFEIIGVENNVKWISPNTIKDHYTMTPYQYTPKKAKKLVPDEFIDIGQGILDLVEDVCTELDICK